MKLKLIAVVLISSPLLNAGFYIAILLGYVDEYVSQREYVETALDLIVKLILLVGIWSYKTWAWKLCFIYLPLSIIYLMPSVYLFSYSNSTELYLAFVVLVYATVLQYFNRADIRELFSLKVGIIDKVHIVPKVMFASGIAFLCAYLIDNFVALIVGLIAFFGMIHRGKRSLG